MSGEEFGRKCTQCGEKKPLKDFYRKGNRHESICKECKKSARNKRYQKSQAKLNRYKDNRISKVSVERYKGKGKRAKNEFSFAESILEKILLKALMDK